MTNIKLTNRNTQGGNQVSFEISDVRDMQQLEEAIKQIREFAEIAFKDYENKITESRNGQSLR